MHRGICLHIRPLHRMQKIILWNHIVTHRVLRTMAVILETKTVE